MNNADSPAMPVSISGNDIGDVWNSLEIESGGGLTKREHFSGLAMQGLLCLRAGGDVQEIAQISVSFADALLEELEND